MKIIVLSIFVSVFCVKSIYPLHMDELVMPQESIDFVNQSQDLWTASSSWVGEMTIAEAMQYTHTQIKPSTFKEYDWGLILNFLTIPQGFDSRNQWPKCIHPIQSQGKCSSSWAFAASEVLSDLFCIASKGSTNIVLSAQYIISCDYMNDGCTGGYADLAWEFMANGVPTSSCIPYYGQTTYCPSTCSNGLEMTLYYPSMMYTYIGQTAIQAAILMNGPVQSTFMVYQDFMSYSGGIYTHVTGAYLGNLSVKIIGWGSQNGFNYWICANSLGSSWGLNGFFFIAFGQCGIDSQAISGVPQI